MEEADQENSPVSPFYLFFLFFSVFIHWTFLVDHLSNGKGGKENISWLALVQQIFNQKVTF